MVRRWVDFLNSGNIRHDGDFSFVLAAELRLAFHLLMANDENIHCTAADGVRANSSYRQLVVVQPDR